MPGIEYRGRLFINHNVNFLHKLQNNSVYRTCTVKISLAPPGLRKLAVTARNMYRMRRHLKVHRVDPEKYFPNRRNLKALEDFKPKIPSLFEIKLPFTSDPFNVTAT